MTERSRFGSVLFSVLFLFFCAVSADAAYRPMDAIPQARTDAFYVVGELRDLKEMTSRLSYSFAVNRASAETDALKYFPRWLRNSPVQQAAFLIDFSPLKSKKFDDVVRLNIALSFGEEQAALLKKIQRKKATPEEIYRLLFADEFLDKMLSDPEQRESADFLRIRPSEKGRNEYLLDTLDMKMTARGNLLLISIESGLEEMMRALNTPSLRHEEKRALPRENSVVMQMGEELMETIQPKMKEVLPYKTETGAVRFETSITLQDNGWDLRAVTNLPDLVISPADAEGLSQPLAEGSFLSAGGQVPFMASVWHLTPSRIQRAINENKLPTALWLDVASKKYNNAKNASEKNPFEEAKNILSYLKKRDPNGNLFKIFNTVSLVSAGEKLEKGSYYLALTKGDAAAVALLDQYLSGYIQKNNASKRYKRTTPQGWDAVYTLNMPNKASDKNLLLALHKDQVLLGWMDSKQLNTPLNTSGKMVEDLIANRTLSEFIYFDVEKLRGFAWEKLLSDDAQKSIRSERDRYFLSRMLLLLTDIKEIGVGTTSIHDFNFRFITGQPSDAEKVKLLTLP